MSKTFEGVQYDDASRELQLMFKEKCEGLEELALEGLYDGRSRSLALTKLEEFYTWVGKAIRDDQNYRARLTNVVGIKRLEPTKKK